MYKDKEEMGIQWKVYFLFEKEIWLCKELTFWILNSLGIEIFSDADLLAFIQLVHSFSPSTAQLCWE